MSTSDAELAERVEQFVEQLRSSTPSTAREFAARFPHLAPDLLPALEAAEELEYLRTDTGAEIDEGLERLGSFRIERELGRGGMGIVLEAFDEALGRSVALKLLPRSMLTSPAARARFQREATLAARLDHPGICTVHGAGVTDGQPWIAMRKVEGRSISESIAAARASGARCALIGAGSASDAPRDLANCIARVARALAFAHARGVIHRDVKPSNVIVTADGQPVLLDFGVAFESDSDAPALTRTGETTGTPAYLAPELISGERARSDERCDVYALGVTLYECLTLRPPFAAPTRDSLYRAILDGAPADVRRLNPQTPRDLSVIIATAIERDPDRRYASAEAFADDLEAFVAGRDIAARPAGRIEKLGRWAKREPRQAALASALLVAGLCTAVAGGMLFASRDQARAGREAQRTREIDDALASAYASQGEDDRESAVRAFDSVLALDPHNEEALVGKIITYLRSRKNEPALELLRNAPRTPAFDRLRAMTVHPPDLHEDPAWLEHASAFEIFVASEALRIEGERRPPSEQKLWWRVALDLVDEAIARAPEARIGYHQMRVLNAGRLGDEQKVRSACRALVAMWPDSAWSLYQAGAALAAFDPQRALELLQRSAELDPTRAPTFQCIGMAHNRLGRFEEALAPLRKALELDPRDVMAHNGLGVVWQNMGCDDEARAEYYAGLAIDPWKIDLWANLTRVAPSLEESAAAAEHVIELDPGQTGHRAVYASALFERHEYARARDEFARLVAEVADNPAYWVSYASALANNGELEAALDAVEVLRSLSPDEPGMRDFEAQVRAALDARR